MLQEDDLKQFLELYNDAISTNNYGVTTSPVLNVQSDGLFPAEIKRLSKSVAIASILGDAPSKAAIVIQNIFHSLDGQERYVPLSNSEAWILAIRNSEKQANDHGGSINEINGIGRAEVVGFACLRLRNKGFHVDVGAYGPYVDKESQEKICRNVENHIASIGGIDCLQQICNFFNNSNRIYDGMWLFGDRVPNINQTPVPAAPFGWLFSLAIKHLDKRCSTSNPSKEWSSAIELAIDFAATFDCQRYSQFEQIDVHACEFFSALSQSLNWRELFALPQVPSVVIDALDGAFSEVEWPSNSADAKKFSLALIDEIRKLLPKLSDHTLSTIRQDQIERECPNLWRVGRKNSKEVNKNYLHPFSMDIRDHDSVVLFELDDENVLLLPKPFLMAAACDVIFGSIWSSLGKGAAKLVGDIVEKCVAQACRGQAQTIVEQEIYSVGKSKFEIDVGTRMDNEIFLFEMKAKVLTSKARSGDIFAFIEDYTKSYLHMLIQLFRHENNILQGLTSLAANNEDDIRIMKVAVSPLSFGPASDRVLANSLLRSIASAKLHPVEVDSKTSRITDEFNDAIDKLMAEIKARIPEDAEEIDLHSLLFDVFWLDLGQLLYILHRADEIKDALKPITFLTFTTRDFWTEFSLIDRQGLTNR
jgi:hypothetical protein